MAVIIKCKMCGGDLHITEGSTVCECEYCGTKQTVPTLDNEKKLTLFARAGRLLRNCEFDKASGVFESIVAEFPEEAEAYWGLVLCKYGIEYVDDPATGKKIPTCHRSSFDSVFDDTNYEQACENTDAVARKVYRDEARQLEELRKSIIEVSGREEPYDIFISYKETDENGNRTLDSVIAQDIYKELTNEGNRVFFSRISLEDKLGVEYEPYIFAALNSAKVMLVVGTDYENFDAVWVKNEWSRFLKLIAGGQKKVLIPVFKNMDPYDMPREFSKLAAQDMGKVGAMQDLLRGVGKILGDKKDSTNNQMLQPTSIVSANPTVSSLLDRAFMFLEDGDYKKADEYAEKILDIEPRNANAYLCKLMCFRNVNQKSSLIFQEKPLEDEATYQKALRYGDEALKKELSGYNDSIKERIKREEEERRKAEEKRAEEKRKAEEERKKAAEEAREIDIQKIRRSLIETSKHGFGSFGTFQGSQIEWVVLEKEMNRVLLISKYAIDCQQYNNNSNNTTWENSSLRSWLNSVFLNTAFSENERQFILKTKIIDEKPSHFRSKTEQGTEDKIFLISKKEASKYFRSDKARQCEPTTFAKKQGAVVNAYNNCCRWWLRSAGKDQNSVSYVYVHGAINEIGGIANDKGTAVRPAMSINIDR